MAPLPRFTGPVLGIQFTSQRRSTQRTIFRRKGLRVHIGMFLEVPATKIRGLVKAAIVDAQSGNLLRGLHEAKNDTCIDILDQANFLCEKVICFFLPAAAVLAGGALETHHKDLCIRNNIAWGGDGSISTYDSAIAQARNKGTLTVYESGDTKLITAWGDDRNCAAHRPTEGIFHAPTHRQIERCS